jgi:NTP pyrophosphatase (non-canonical NTP hydrolase)
MAKVDLKRYEQFVQAVTSDASNHPAAMAARMAELDRDPTLNPALLLTASIGLASETGEFSEIVKKMVFQGKPYNEENRFHMMRELGDIAWYWVNACRALGYDPNEVIAENVKKLEARYPGGRFDVTHSEHRRPGDL